MLADKFVIHKTGGLFPTYPLICALTFAAPSKVVWLHRIYNALLAYAPWCFLNTFECRKGM